jgi:phytoene desaturase
MGFDRKLDNISHHMLFFDTDFEAHAREIYDDPAWPEDPLFYANFTSVTDPESAPKGMEGGFFLIPLAPDLEDTPELRAKYQEVVIERIERHTHQKIKENILFSESYCVNDFKADYNSFKGNAYGMANTLRQTAFLRPSIKSKKVDGLFFTGQLTVPGPGVPPSLISGKIAAEQIIKETKKKAHGVSV